MDTVCGGVAKHIWFKCCVLKISLLRFKHFMDTYRFGVRHTLDEGIFSHI